MDLRKIAIEINEELEDRRKSLQLTFIEDEHKYFMKDLDGNIKDIFPSVSKVLGCFYEKFDADKKSLEISNGDIEQQKLLLEKWRLSGEYATNLGSRVHFELEKYLVEQYGCYKNVRQPIFNCDDDQITIGDNMIAAGKKFINLLHERGAVLLDTEIVLGDNELGYTGQPDKVWLIKNKQETDFGFLITDWKTNQPKNFEVQPYTDMMLNPFWMYHNTALSHYYIQLPLYGKLLLKMLKGTKFENVKLLGCIVTLLKNDRTFQEYRVPQDINSTILNIDITKYTKKFLL